MINLTSVEAQNTAPLGLDHPLKARAIKYYQKHAAIYNERYSVRAAGDLLWSRHRALLELVDRWALPPGSRIVDLGCGPGLLTRDLARLGYAGVGVDTSAAMIRHCQDQAQAANLGASWSYQLGDVECVPLASGSFDAAICSGVIDYLPTDNRLLAEARRLLKPGGRFLLCITNKFGYTVSLSTPLYWLKRLPGVNTFASWMRSLVVGGREGAMRFDFRPRKHRPAQIRNSLRAHGFRLKHDRYTHFSLLPAPLCALTSRLTCDIDRRLDGLDRTMLRVLGSCYILDCEAE
jgi:SAM-dependent methyltransferase